MSGLGGKAPQRLAPIGMGESVAARPLPSASFRTHTVELSGNVA